MAEKIKIHARITMAAEVTPEELEKILEAAKSNKSIELADYSWDIDSSYGDSYIPCEWLNYDAEGVTGIELCPDDVNIEDSRQLRVCDTSLEVVNMAAVFNRMTWIIASEGGCFDSHLTDKNVLFRAQLANDKYRTVCGKRNKDGDLTMSFVLDGYYYILVIDKRIFSSQLVFWKIPVDEEYSFTGRYSMLVRRTKLCNLGPIKEEYFDMGCNDAERAAYNLLNWLEKAPESIKSDKHTDEVTKLKVTEVN